MPLFQAVLIGLTALILAPGALFYFDVTPKLVVLLAGVAVLCVAGSRPAPRLFSLLLLVTVVSLAFSTALSPAPALSLYGSTWRRYGLVAQVAVLLFAWFVSQSPDRRTIIRGISLAGAISAVYGIAQFFGWDPIVPAAAYHIGEGVWTIVRPPGTLGYVSYFATWLLVCGFLSLSLQTRPAYAAAAVCWTAMLLTGTRAALLGLVLGLLVWLYRRGFRVPGRVLAFGVAAIIAAAAFYVTPLGGSLRSRTRWFVEDPWGGARPLLWRDSLRMAGSRLITGHGPETFTAAFPHYESQTLARAYPDFAHESPHNIFLDALVSQGIPGLLCLAALCVIGFRGKDPWIAAALAGAIVAQQFTVFTIPTALLLYAVIALSVAEADRLASSATQKRFARWTFVLAVPLLYLAFRFAAADHSLALARRAVNAGDVPTAAEQFNAYQHYKLPGTAADLWYSRALLAAKAPDPVHQIQAFQLAAAAAERATRTAEDPFDAWYNLATVAAAQNDATKTESALRHAIAAHPHWFKPRWTLAQLLRLEGRIPEALAEAEIAVDLNGGRNPEVAVTLAQLRGSQHK
jgi:O-antigen ligase